VLGSLLERPLAELMAEYRRHRYRQLRRACRQTLSELSESPLPVVNWYQEVARRVNAADRARSPQGLP
jgi:hypothetical protein